MWVGQSFLARMSHASVISEVTLYVIAVISAFVQRQLHPSNNR